MPRLWRGVVGQQQASLHTSPRAQGRPDSEPLSLCAAAAALQEQLQAEQAYLSQGVLFAGATASYWIGLSSNSSNWPVFTWMLKTLPSADSNEAGWDHWGRGQPDDAGPSALCAMASAALSYDGAWGWSGAQCSLQLPFLCRVNGGLLCSF
jgi:hypothetical protein